MIRRNSIHDGPNSGRHLKERTEKIFNKFENFVLRGRRVEILTITNDIGKSDTSVFKILHDGEKFAKGI